MRPVPQTGDPDLNTTLRLISKRAMALTRATGAAIALTHKGSMMCRASIGASAPALGCRLDVSSGFSGESVRTGKALRCDDSETDPRVDGASCRRLKIRSILAAPIPFERDIVGLLEVFSAQPFAFDDGDLAVVEGLAQTVLLTPPALNTVPPPKLQVELESVHRIFFRNLIDILLSLRTAPLRSQTSPTARFWPDVFVPSRLPWERFLQSMLLHVIMLAVLGSPLKFWPSRLHPVQRLVFNKSDVIYYLPSEYPPPMPARVRKRGQSSFAKQPAISVPRERDTRAQTIITSPDIKLKQNLRLLRVVGWNSVAPAVPLSATTLNHLSMPAALVAVIAPPPEVNQALDRRASTGMTQTAVVEPPPEISAASRPRALTAPPPPVITPPPSVHQLIRQVGDINIGHLEVVAPGPQLPLHEQRTFSAAAQLTPGSALTSIVPPSPSVYGLGNPGRQSMRSLPTTAMQVALLATVAQSAASRTGGAIAVGSHLPDVQSQGEAIANRRRTFADTEELSVNSIRLALALPGSSYFPSHEVFIAEERLGPHQSRLIKLVYEFLPYQPRLSEYGPNYPAVDKLRATRDPTCDDTLMQVMSSVNAPGWSQSDGLQFDSKYLNQRQRALACYRTTADDYRRARARQHR